MKLVFGNDLKWHGLSFTGRLSSSALRVNQHNVLQIGIFHRLAGESQPIGWDFLFQNAVVSLPARVTLSKKRD